MLHVFIKIKLMLICNYNIEGITKNFKFTK